MENNLPVNLNIDYRLKERIQMYLFCVVIRYLMFLFIGFLYVQNYIPKYVLFFALVHGILLNTSAYIFWKKGKYLDELPVIIFPLDCLLATFVVYYIGVVSFAILIFVYVVVIGSSVGERRGIWSIPTFVSVCFSIIFWNEQFHFFPYHPQVRVEFPASSIWMVTGWVYVCGSFYFISAVIHTTLFKLDNVRTNLETFLPSQVVSSLATKKQIDIKQHRKKLTIFFSDISGFTNASDKIEPEELSQLLNEYLSEMNAIVNKYGGTLDKFIGDGIMIYFGAPISYGEKEDAVRCVQMAVEMQKKFKELLSHWITKGVDPNIDVRMGINTGYAAVGVFGSQKRMDYTAIGRQVNIASRLEQIAELGEIVISHSTYLLVKDYIDILPKGEFEVKGLHEIVKTYMVKEHKN